MTLGGKHGHENFFLVVKAMLNSSTIIYLLFVQDHEGLILNRTMGVKDAGIKVGAHLYLSTLESERALFSYTNWWLVAAICKFFAVG